MRTATDEGRNRDAGTVAGWQVYHFRRSVRRALLRSTRASWAASGLCSEVFGPRLAGANAPKTLASRWLRQSVRAEE